MNRTAAAAIAGSLALIGGTAASPRYSVLPPAWGARWITCARPVNLGVWRPGETFAYFQTRLVVGERPPRAVVRVRALRDASLRVDAREALAPRGDLSRWRDARDVDLAELLPPGEHVLTLVAMDRDGPAAVWLRSEDPAALPLRTDEGWSASCDGKTWAPARPASLPPDPEWLTQAPTAAQGLARAWPWLLAAAALALWLDFPRRGGPRGTLAGLLLWWAALAVLCLRRMPEGVGYDAAGHLQYARFIRERHALPLATEGWQAFQPPLYYIIAAALGAGERLLRALNLLAGAGLIAASARFLARALPGRRELQTAGLLVAGLLPMTAVLCQMPGNEPLCALLTALALTEALRWLDGERAETAFGGYWGAALLAKATAVLLAPSVLLAARRRPAGLLKAAAIAGLLSGWYYLWVWARLGRPFVGGWDAARGQLWWQDPGCRSLADLARFGRAAARPFYAGLRGFWDALYSTTWADGWLSGMTSWASRPPWRYGFAAACAALSLVPSALIFAGAWRAARGRGGAGGRLSLAGAGVYLAALLWMFLRLSAYSAVKASYAAGLAPALGLLAALGYDALPAGPARRVTGAALGAWAAAAALAYLSCQP